MVELGRIAKQRYLDAGGNPHLSVGSLNNNDTLTDEEKQEFLELANQVFDDESIANYLKKMALGESGLRRWRKNKVIKVVAKSDRGWKGQSDRATEAKT